MKKKKTNIAFIICLLVLIVVVIIGVTYKVKQKQNASVYKNLAEEVIPEPETDDDISAESEQDVPEIPVDFQKLQEQNPDIYAWIRIDDTQVDYPIAHSQEDEDYYLDHTIEGAEGLPGSIYTQYSYNQDFETDKVTVIYGHNMRDDSMFGGLSDYLDEGFRDSHSEIQIYTPEHIYTYKVVCAVTYDDRHILAAYSGCTDALDYEKFLESLQTERKLPSWIEEPLGVTTEDRMIVLSTCNGNSSQRFLIGAVLTDEE